MDGATVLVGADDGSLPLREGEKTADLLRERANFELDVYYPWLEPFTMQSKFVDVPYETAKAWRLFNRGAALDPDSHGQISRVRDQVDAAIKTFRPANPPLAESEHHMTWAAFVRLSTRSPKDAVDKMDSKIVPLLREELERASRTVRSPSSVLLSSLHLPP
jgi:hypothetical protein